MALLAVWPVLSAHAWLEAIGLIHIAHSEQAPGCDGPDDPHDHHDADHDVADGLCLLSSHSLDVPAPSMPAIHAGFLWEIVEGTTGPALSPYPSGLAPPGTSPPELIHRWQFSFRTALPARAPSFVT